MDWAKTCKTKQGTIKFWDLVRLILDVWRYTKPILGQYCDILRRQEINNSDIDHTLYSCTYLPRERDSKTCAISILQNEGDAYVYIYIYIYIYSILNWTRQRLTKMPDIPIQSCYNWRQYICLLWRGQPPTVPGVCVMCLPGDYCSLMSLLDSISHKHTQKETTE